MAHPSASLYVGDLHPEVNESMLYDMFNAIGPVVTVRVCRDLQTRRSLGYGYVNFQEATDAQHAMGQLNFTPLYDRNIRVMWVQRDPSQRRSGVGNVFVKNLDKEVDHKALFEAFARFGNILSCRIGQDEQGLSRGYAYIQFDSADAAQKAIAEGTGMTVRSGPVSVVAFQRRADRVGSSFTNVYIKGFDPATVAEPDLRALVGQFGEVTSLFAPAEEGKLKGYAFANFKDAAAARVAVETLHAKEHGGRVLYVQRAQSKKEREAVLRQQQQQRAIERQRRFQGLNLFVKNLDDAVEDAQLMQAFSPFGTITSAKVMRDETGASKGFGFVCFSTPEDAARAMAEMHNALVGGKPVYVAMHQPADQRRAYLAQVRSMRFNAGPQRPGVPAMAGAYQPVFPYPAPAARGPQPQGAQFQPGFGPRGPAPFARQPLAAGQFPPMGFVPRGPATGPRGPRGPRPQGAAGQPMPQQRGGVAFRPSARNVGGEQPSPMPVPAASTTNAPAAGGAQPLTIESLAGMDQATQNRVLGERLYPLVMQLQPQRGPKVTGMLLQMDSSEILNLLESREALAEAVREACEVLGNAGMETAQPQPLVA